MKKFFATFLMTVLLTPCTYALTKNNKTPVYVAPLEFISTKDIKVYEGKEVDFKVIEDVKKDGKVAISKDTIATGRVEVLTQNEIYGDPADIMISNFTLKQNGKSLKLDGSINKVGANRSIWVAPIGYYGALLTLGLSLPLLAVRGGHAKLYPKKTYILYF